MNKYHNKITYVDNIRFMSQGEANRYCELKLLQRAKQISDLKFQVPFEIIPKQKDETACKYIADFAYTEKGKTVVEDFKGKSTDAYIMIFDKQNAPQNTRYLARWVNNKPIFRQCEKFEDYDSKKG